MNFVQQIQYYLFQYYGIDWLITFMIFASIFLLGNKRIGFIFGILGQIFAFIFSFQIGSIANGFMASILFILYFRGYLKWKTDDQKLASK